MRVSLYANNLIKLDSCIQFQSDDNNYPNQYLYKILIISLIGLLFWLKMADFQANAQGGLGFGGDVPLMCRITSTPTRVQGNNMALAQADFSDGTIILDQLVDDNTARLQPGSIKLRFNAMCNGPHQVSVRSDNGALKPTPSAPPLTEAFLPQINYTATATWADNTIAIVADGNSATAQAARITARAASGPLELTIRVDGSINDMTRPLASGEYSDTLFVTLAPRI